jgi:ABC-type sugar transport system ATPase subunit
MASVQLRHIQHRFGETLALDGFDLNVDSGDYVVLLGENGCGKTTALRVIAGLEKPNRGSVFVDGRCMDGVPPRNRSVGMVFQSSSLYPHLTAGQNISFGLKPSPAIHRAIELVEVGRLLDRYPGQLSGGQLRRVAIAKAIAGEHPIRLLDEPLSALDIMTGRRLERELMHVHRTVGGTTIHVTHDASEAVRVADKIAVMHQGRLLQFDSPKLIDAQPSSIHVANLIGTAPMNWLAALVCDNTLRFENRAVEAKGDWSTFLNRFPKLPARVLVGVRPDCFRPTHGDVNQARLSVHTHNAKRRDLGHSSTWLSSLSQNTSGEPSFAEQNFCAAIADARSIIAADQFDAAADDALLFDAESGLAIKRSVAR